MKYLSVLAAVILSFAIVAPADAFPSAAERHVPSKKSKSARRAAPAPTPAFGMGWDWDQPQNSKANDDEDDSAGILGRH